MQKIIKQAGPSRQLFETVNFAFMKIFDFLIKTALLIMAENRAMWLYNQRVDLVTELDFRP